MNKTTNKVMAKIQIVFYVIFGLMAGPVTISYAADSTKVAPPPKENFHLFILAGQSNMAGRGKVYPRDRKPPERVVKLSKNGKWVPATDPVHYDKPVAGVGPGRSFGIALARRDTNITVGLIPCAVGGSSITAWKPGGYHAQTKSHPYDDCLKRVRAATKDGVLKAILWHQGASDSDAKLAPGYEERLHKFIPRFRHDLNSPDLPFISGQLAHFKNRPWNKWRKMVNQANASLSDQIPYTAFVISDGLTGLRDLKHFDSASARDLGRRYAQAYINLMKKNCR